MKNLAINLGVLYLISLLLVANFVSIDAYTWKPSRKIRRKNLPLEPCNKHNDTDYYKVVDRYYTTTFKRSLLVNTQNKATLTLNSFENGGDGGGPSECDSQYHSDDTLVVALSTIWFNHKRRCSQSITIYGNGKKVDAKVVDECDSTRGCRNNIVDASKAVWMALEVTKSNWGEMDIYWTDA